ncbi:MAG: aldo/keto reductase family protein [Candidatus Zixiibacteriota bacterium]|nr:MAG: aldo/keto reductase family protein [candidate division Zixibacteria bacterium]
MNYRRVGNSGLKISEISLGAWLTYGGSVLQERAIPIIHTAIERGVNFIDIADIYSKGEAEKTVGAAIKDYRRSDLVISSKVFWPMSDNVNDRGLSRKHIMESIDKSLSRIGTDYLDIYFCHRFDPGTPIEETARAMSDLVQAGKILYWGTSVWDADQIDEAVVCTREWKGYLPAVEQPRYNLIDRHIEVDIMPTCARHGMGLTVWSPLAQGLLTGKYNDGTPTGSRGQETSWMDEDLNDGNIKRVRKLGAIAADHGMTVAQMALAWVLGREEISCAIVGATTVDQLEENLKATDLRLDQNTLGEIENIFPVTN